MSILETIDNAVQDWETSGDAMRWTPEPTQAPDMARWQADVARAFGVPAGFLALPRISGPTPEEAAAIGARITAAFEPLSRQLSRFAEGARVAAFDRLWLDEVFWDRCLPPARQRARVCHPRRDPRVRATRWAYRHKTRNRW